MSTTMFAEITQQPDVLQRQIEQGADAIDRLCARIREFEPSVVVFAARGSSDNAARYGKYLLGALAGFPVALATPSLVTRYQSPPDLSRALVVGISQSGASPDIVEVVARAREQGALTAAITVYPDSNLAQAAELTVPLLTGPEKAVAATKTYTAELAAIAMLASTLAPDPRSKQELASIPDLVREALQVPEQAFAQAAEHLLQARTIAVVGRGFNYGTAMEIALKIQESSYVLAHPFSSADFRHGPLALVEAGFPVVLVDVEGAVREDVRQLARTVREQGGRPIWITDDRNVGTGDLRQIVLPVPQSPEWISPLVTVVAGQRLALALALAKGLDPDNPRSLRKVTETR